MNNPQEWMSPRGIEIIYSWKPPTSCEWFINMTLILWEYSIFVQPSVILMENIPGMFLMLREYSIEY